MTSFFKIQTGITAESCPSCVMDVKCIPDSNQKCSNLFEWTFGEPKGTYKGNFGQRKGTFTTTGGQCPTGMSANAGSTSCIVNPDNSTISCTQNCHVLQGR